MSAVDLKNNQSKKEVCRETVRTENLCLSSTMHLVREVEMWPGIY